MSNTGSPNPSSKFAWSEIHPQDLPKRSAPERIADFLEVHGAGTEAAAREQASRCIQCPNPSCAAGCPLCNPIPQWMLLTAEGRFLEAAAVLGSVTNMAEICARLCDSARFCEQSCILESRSESVSIRALEQFLGDYALAHGAMPATTPPPNGLRVAVVGAGPGGLVCADTLLDQGCGVTLFDAGLVPGGLLVNGVPAFKLDRSIVHRRIENLRQRGAEFRLGIRLGTDLTLGQLRSEFDAVYLGFDSRQARPFQVPGAQSQGVVQALPFILQKSSSIRLELPPLDMSGSRVVVIGGGDTALDAARTAVRCGARQVTCIYRRDEASLPCTRHEYINAMEEGVAFQFQATPVAVLERDGRWARGVRFLRTGLGQVETNGRRAFHVLPGTEFDIEADWVIPALGFDPLPCLRTGDFAELAVNDWGGIVVDGGQMTNLPGVFAGGDLTRGPSLILHAVRDARQAAHQILRWTAGWRKGGKTV